MSTERQAAVTVQDLVEEAKKRVVFLIICAIGLSYLMSRKCSFPPAPFFTFQFDQFSLTNCCYYFVCRSS